MPTRLLIVTFDSAEPLLVEEWARQGALRTLASMLDRGHRIPVENFAGFGNGVFWPSLHTGVDPSHHGRYYRYQPRSSDFSLAPFDEDRAMQATPFWGALEAEGLRVAVVDPVETAIGCLSKGLEVAGWMPHGRSGAPRSFPAEVIRRLHRRYGVDPLGGNSDRAVNEGMGLDELSAISCQRIATKTRAMHELLEQDEWDVFYATFADPHDIGHLAWHLHSSCGDDEKDADPLYRCYRALDSALSCLMEAVAAGGQTIVVMGPGMEANVGANPMLPEILRRLQRRPRHSLLRLGARAARTLTGSRLLPFSLRKRLRDLRGRVGLTVQRASARPFSSVPHNDNAGAVRLNVAGRDPHGTVQVGRPYRELCGNLSAQLLRLRDASGAVPLVDEVIETRSLYRGPLREVLPDLMVVWNREADVSAATSEQIGWVSNPGAGVRSGDHSRRGLVISDAPLTPPERLPVNPTEVTPILLQSARRLAGSPFPAAPAAAPA